MYVISVEEVRKVFRVTEKQAGMAGSLKALFRPQVRHVTALDGVSFDIEAGEMVGYIGVNGAGKSTTIKILTGILVPTSGCVTVLGRDPSRERIANAAEIGVVFGQRSQLWWDLPLIESLDLVARIYEIGTGRYRELLDEFTDILDLGDLLKKPIREMSLGQKMRSELAATLIHEPKVVYLDEPTVGLDLIVKERIRQFIKRQNAERGTTVILTTHDLGDIEELCRRVIIIDAGRIVYDGPLAAIAARFGSYRTIAFETADPAPELELPAGAELIDRGQAHRVTLRFDRTHTTASRVAAAVMSQVEVLDLSITEPDLASIVRQIYDGALETRP
jgi:ABC-2 type transport system ATP-binding protein